MKSVILLICLLFVFSCKDAYLPEEQPYSVFVSNKILQGETVSLDTLLSHEPYRIIVKDSILLVLDLQNTAECCHAFTYPGGNHLASFGTSAPLKKPGDPEGVTLPERMIHFYSLDSIWVLTGNKMELIRWQLFPSERRAEAIETIHLDKKLHRAQSFSVTDSCFWLTDYTGKCRYHRVDYTGKRISSVGRIPTRRYYKDGDSPTVALGWSHVADFLPGKDLLVMASCYGETIELYNVREGSFKMLIGPNQYPKFSIRGEDAIPRGVIGFDDVQVTENCIYAIFEDRLVQELKHARIQGINPERGGRYIYQFDLDGTPLCKYTLDHSISGFHIDEAAGFIFATDLNGGDPVIRFKL